MSALLEIVLEYALLILKMAIYTGIYCSFYLSLKTITMINLIMESPEKAIILGVAMLISGAYLINRAKPNVPAPGLAQAPRVAAVPAPLFNAPGPRFWLNPPHNPQQRNPLHNIENHFQAGG